MTSRRHALLALCTSAALPARARLPDQPIQLIVGFAPGGTTDTAARALADAMRKSLPQAVVVENTPGAAGQVGIERASKAKADGSVLYFGGAELLQSSLGRERLAPVASVAAVPMVLVASPVATLDSLQRKDAPTVYAPGYHAPLLLGQLPLPKARVIDDYKGPLPALMDVLAGKLDAALVQYPVAKGDLASGRLKALAVAGPADFPGLRNVPPMPLKTPELATVFLGVFAPVGIARETVGALGGLIGKALRDDGLLQRFKEAGIAPNYADGKELGRLVQVLYGVTPDPCKKRETCQKDSKCPRPCPDA